MRPTHNTPSRPWLTTIFSDPQFWVPLGVLIGGLLLLHSIH
jgi:hypothetical protein